MTIIETHPTATRWISVAFLQGDEADELLALIDQEGPIAAIYQLRQLDDGDRTLEAALVNGYVYDEIPSGESDHTIEPFGFPYALTYNESFRYVSLLRHYNSSAEPAPAMAPLPRAHAELPPRRPDMAWFSQSPVGTPGISALGVGAGSVVTL